MNIRQKALLIAILASAANLSADPSQKNGMLAVLPMDAADVLYTGKPYDADLEAYVFNYRNFSPELGRWTSTDPSGFPDGPNNSVYAPCPISQLDPAGLLTVSGTTTPNLQELEVDYHGTKIKITATDIKHISSSAFDQTYSGYTFHKEADLDGTLGVDEYSVHDEEGQEGGAWLQVSVSDVLKMNGAGWIQVITTNKPPTGKGNTYLDNDSPGWGPFYPQYPDGQSGWNWFEDFSYRQYNLLSAELPSISWTGQLFYARKSNSDAYIYDGIEWSWTMAIVE